MTVCTVCNDTHVMNAGDRQLNCTACPLPCPDCRVNGTGAYCAAAPCSCACHEPGVPHHLVSDGGAVQTRQALRIVDVIVADIADRRGLRQGWDGVSEQHEEIRAAWIDLVKEILE